MYRPSKFGAAYRRGKSKNGRNTVPLTVTHLAFTVSDGAGIAALRQFAALDDAGIRGRFLTAIPVPGCDPAQFATITPHPASILQRVLRRCGIASSAEERMQQAATQARNNSGGGEEIEMFSTPFSRYSPETHPWFGAADIVHLHWVAGFIDWPWFFSRVRKPIVWTLHDQQPYLGGFHYGRDRDIAPQLRPLEDRCLAIKRAAATSRVGPIVLVGNSRWNTAEAKRSEVFPANVRYATVYYPLDCSVYSPREKDIAKHALGLAPESFVVGFASTSLDNPRKGLSTFIDAVNRLPSSDGKKVQLLSFGRDPEPVARQAVNLPWSHLGFLQADPVKALAYSAMDVFVIPSLAEAFGQTAIEALACGTAVIGANVGGIPEAMPAAFHSWLFNSGDVADLRNRLQFAIDHAQERSEYAKTGRAHVVAQHSRSIAAGAYAQIYRELLQSP